MSDLLIPADASFGAAALALTARPAPGSLFEGTPFSEPQQAWLNGFLAGLAAMKRNMEEGQAAPTLTLEILYGSQTGNSEMLAQQLGALARGKGYGANLTELDAMTPEKLATLPYVLVITSTYGEGEMPDNAELFWEALSAPTAPRLEDTRFAVLSLGDSGYDDFCQAGRDIDLRFEQLGAGRIVTRVDCDVDFEEPAEAWIEETLAAIVAEAPPGAAGSGEAAAPAPARSPWNKKTPFPSKLSVNRVLSGDGSAKEIRHFEFDLGDSGITYAAGDALAVVPVNDPALVELLLARLELDGDADAGGESLRERMLREWEIATPSKDLIAAIAERDPEGELAAMVRREDRAAMDSWLWGRDTLDLLEGSPEVRFSALELSELLRPLQARSYSISSSPLQSPDRIHLTVASVRHGREREHGGVTSTYLADRLDAEQPVGIYLQPNNAFSVPEDGDRPVVMIGPGTGIAPFRGFLHERAESGAKGPNWLFFGDQHAASDFIYRDELEAMQASGVLTRLDLAFSRDQAEKIYVQTRMREQGAELYAWLEQGGYLYVCGDATRMAKDVEHALLEIVQAHRGCSEAEANEYVSMLKREKRYVRDVY